jgi:hypothetical protein
MQIRVVLAIVVCLWPSLGAAQTEQVPQVDIPDLIRMVRKQPASTNQSPSEANVSFLPTISSNPAIGVGFGVVASLASRRTGPDGPMSSAQASFTLTTKKQVIGALRNNFYSRSENWSLVGDVRLAKFYQRGPRLGSDEPVADAGLNVDYNWIRLYQTAYRRVGGAFHLGLGYHLDSFIDIEPADSEADTPADDLSRTTVASGLSVGGLFDSRDNPLNAGRGVYARASYHWYPEALGSDSDWQSLQLDGRAYVRMPSARRQVLAAWIQAWQTLDGNPPYFNLPSVGWDTYGRSGRGYTAGSLRGRDWGYLEGEYRIDLMRNGFMGAVGFVNASTLSDRAGVYGEWAVGGGAGLRFKLDKKHGTNIAMDFAWGRNGSKGVWFGLNEVF